MTNVPAQSEASVLDKLRQRAAVARTNFLPKPSLNAGQVRMWSASVLRYLGDLFGTSSQVYMAFPSHHVLVPTGKEKEVLAERLKLLESIIKSVTDSAQKAIVPNAGNSVFIGHGRSPLWREFKDFVEGRLHLPWDEFNRESTAGVATTERLTQMLENATFAFLIMTGEDEHADATLHARENVIHEVGLFQGRLGMRRAIILKEEGCQVFSNIHGLTYIGFPKNNINATFEQIRLVLEREGIIESYKS